MEQVVAQAMERQGGPVMDLEERIARLIAPYDSEAIAAPSQPDLGTSPDPDEIESPHRFQAARADATSGGLLRLIEGTPA